MTASGPVPLRVASYNVHGLKGGRAAVAETVRALSPDVVLVQEGPRRLRWRQQCAALARGCGLVVGGGGQPAAGNLILTDLRVRVVRTWWVRFPLTPGRHLRGAAFARCEVAGVRFLAAGAHLSTDPAERPQQAHLLAQILAGVDVPVVLGADLNDGPGSPTWQPLAATLHDPDGDAARPTYPAPAPRRRIDAVLVDPRITVGSYRVAHPPRRPASDHLPVVADLLLSR